MAFFNAHISKWSACMAGLWLMVGGGIAAAAGQKGSEGDGGAAVARLQAELPERKFHDFEPLLKMALTSGPAIIMREWEAAAAAEEARGARAPMLPSLNATVNAGATREQRRSPTRNDDRTFTAVLYSVGFYQPVFHWGALKDNYRIGQIRQAVSERNMEETRRLLAVDIRRRYFDVILAANGVKLARENIRRLENDRKNTEQLIADGAAAPGAIDGSNRALDMARPELEQAENQYAALRLSFAHIAGVDESELDRLPDAIPSVEDIFDALKALSASVSAPPSAELQNIDDSISVEKLTYEINRTRQLPKIGFSASAVQMPDNSNVTERSILTSWNASLSVNWNIFDGFATSAAKRTSLNRLRALETRREQAGKQESAERRAEVARLLVQWQQLQNSERDLARTRAGAELTEQDFAAGMTSQNAVDNARYALAQALQGIYSARASFYTALASCLSNRGQDPVMQNNNGALAPPPPPASSPGK